MLLRAREGMNCARLGQGKIQTPTDQSEVKDSKRDRPSTGRGNLRVYDEARPDRMLNWRLGLRKLRRAMDRALLHVLGEPDALDDPAIFI